LTVVTQQPSIPVPDGISVREIKRPESADAVADALRAASESGAPVLPFGGGTSLGTGNVVEEPFLGLDLRGLSGVRDYQPTDLTASFWAGTCLQDVVAILAEQGQEMPLDIPQAASGTIGGLVATGFAGPRRLGSGTLKDLIIGCGYVRGDGLAAKAGGMLVKNVSGFEIPRLLHGSWGALAIITSVNLKVTPKPKADVTISQHYSVMGDALAAQASLLQRHATIGASVAETDTDGWTLHVRLLGRPGSLEAQLVEIRDELGSCATVVESDVIWRDHGDRWARSGDDVHVVIGDRPRRIAGLAESLATWNGVRAMTVSVGTGSIRIRLDPQVVAFPKLDERLRGWNATWLVESAPVSWKSNASVWGPSTDGHSLMQAIKHEFDPAGILNRGRLFIENR
jgi:glycolate oxidase FAD binding subunit